MHLYPRFQSKRVEEALQYSRVTLLLGPRQAGKSTLARQLVDRGLLTGVLTLDNRDTRLAAQNDPVGMIAEAETPIAIDEIQREPELLLAVKERVDRDTRPGQFLLTGSANVLTAPRVLDALTGRTEIVTLWPLASGEIAAGRSEGAGAGDAAAPAAEPAPATNLIDLLLAGQAPQLTDQPRGQAAWAERALAGGYPEALERPPGRHRSEWFESLLSSLISRDLRDISSARLLSEVPQLLRALAGLVGSPLVVSRLSQKTGMAANTIGSYLQLLETAYVTRTLHAWRPGVAGRERRAPKVMFTDTGVLSHLLEADRDRLANDSATAGAMFENYVAMEVTKLAAWAERLTSILHYRQEGEEIDLICEARSGEFIAVEAKAAASVGRSDLRALTRLRDARSEQFKAGVVVYAGERTVRLGDRLWALPVGALWQGR